MGIYIGLVIFVLSISFIASVWGNPKRKDNFILFSSCLALFAIYVLRDFSVGRDLPGYYEVYENMQTHTLFDASWIWMEWGFVLLMKLSSLLGLSFRAFLAIVYALVLIPLSIFLKRYSRNVTLSIIIFICFQFFVFSMSAVRQTLAMSVCMAAYMVANKNGLKSFLWYCILIAIAVLIHRSAIVFAPVYLLMRKKSDLSMILIYITILLLAYFAQGDLLDRLSQLGESKSISIQENLDVGTFFYFMLLIIVIAYIMIYKKSRKAESYGLIGSIMGHKMTIQQSLTNHLNLFVCCIIIEFAFRGFMLMRAATYYQFFLLLVLPNLIEEFPKELRPFLRFVVIVGMLFIFYYSTLRPNELDIVPYRFGF